MIGNRIGRYEIVAQLGQGGMATVYKARDPHLDRFVALKLPVGLRTEDELVRARFLAEARAASALDHPNICTIYEVAESDEDGPYIAMAFYEGQTLRELLAQGPLSPERAVRVAIQVAAALEEAHSKEIVHRDVKPANLLLTARGVVKVLDFGLARLKGSDLTESGSLVGTARYMSPEQVAGEQVDQRSDLWSLGVVMYEMLTGKLPFRGETSQALLYAILEREPRALVSCPFELNAIVLRTLVKRPQDRFQSATRLRGRLEHFLQTQGSSGPVDSGGDLSQVETMLHRPVRRWGNSIAVLPFRNMSPDAEQDYFCGGVTEQIINSLTRIRGLKVIGRSSVMAYKETEKTAPEICRELGVEHILDGSIQKSGSKIRVGAELVRGVDGSSVWAKNFDRDLQDIFRVQDDVSRAIVDSLRLTLTPGEEQAIYSPRAENIEAYEHAMKAMHFTNKYYFALDPADFESAKRMGKSAIEADPTYIFGYISLSYALALHYFLWRKDEDLAECERYADQAFRLDPTSSWGFMALGGVAHLKEDNREAFRFFKHAIQLDPNNALAVHFIGRTLGYGFGLHREAIRCYSRTVELDPLYAFAYHNRGFSLMTAGNVEAAAIDFEKALELQPSDHQALAFYAELAIGEGQVMRAAELIESLEGVMPPLAAHYRALLRARKGDEEAYEQHAHEKVAALLGMRDEAIELLHRRAESQGHVGYLELKNSPFYESLRDDERFGALLEEERGKLAALPLTYREVDAILGE